MIKSICPSVSEQFLYCAATIRFDSNFTIAMNKRSYYKRHTFSSLYLFLFILKTLALYLLSLLDKFRAFKLIQLNLNLFRYYFATKIWNHYKLVLETSLVRFKKIITVELTDKHCRALYT